MTKYNIKKTRKKKAVYKTSVSPERMDAIQEMINQIIVIQKKYRDKEYSAKQLAEELGVRCHEVSATMNARFHMSYTSFVNKYRIDEAKSILVDGRYQDLNMEEVRAMVGFSNRQSFYSSFYKYVGITPCNYRLQQLRKYLSLIKARIAKTA